MKTFKKRRSAQRVGSKLALIMVLVGLGLLGYSVWVQGAPMLQAYLGADENAAPADHSTTMTLNIPKMDLEDIEVRSTPVADTSALDAGAQHVEGTGFPWEEGSNVYIAGHRIGFPATGSYLVFYDLDALQNGDEVFLTDSEGKTYTYSVFKTFTVNPSDYEVTQPVPGKSIVSLQTCTLPDYSQRYIVQAELVESSQDEAPQEDVGAPQEEAPLTQYQYGA